MPAMPMIRSRSWTRRAVQGLLVIALLATGAIAPLSGVAADSSTVWRGEYYNNKDLSGSPVTVRDDGNVNFNWGTSAPASGVNADNFSVRWTKYQYFDGGAYTFYATSDDGIRVWVDEQLIIDRWYDHSEATFSAARSLSAGYHSMRVEYYDSRDRAVARVWWDNGGGGSPAPAGDWQGQYYVNTWLGGSPIMTRTDANLNFDWGYGSPGGGVPADNFSARWTRSVYINTAGQWTFTAITDDGIRVWVDGALIIDRWYPQSRTIYKVNTYLGVGTHQIKVEYFEASGAAVAVVDFAYAGGGTTPPTPPPSGQEIIVDNRDAGFVWGGLASSWYSANAGYAGHLYWTYNGSTTLYNWAKWFPNITAPGNYEVYVYVANRYFGSKAALYRVYHNGARDDRVINQNNYSNQWVSLGTYYFSGGSNEYVFLGDNTGEAYGTRYLGFDAMRFVARSGGGTTPPPSGCSITPVLGFGRVWNGYSAVRSRLNCATEVEKSIWAGEEYFQGGYMVWRSDLNKIYVLYNNGTWVQYDDTWTTAEPEWDGSIVPPWGYFQPKRGFGKVWRNDGNVRNGLGWATTEERGFQGSVQQFQGGTMLWSNTRGIMVLYNDGRWERYN